MDLSKVPLQYLEQFYRGRCKRDDVRFIFIREAGITSRLIKVELLPDGVSRPVRSHRGLNCQFERIAPRRGSR